MKRKDKKKNDNNKACYKGVLLLAKAIALGLMCFVLILILIRWNRVPRFQHYLYLSHPYSSNASDARCFTIAEVDLLLTNGFDVPCNQEKQHFAEKYSFRLLSKPKRQDVSLPQYHALDSVLRFISRNDNGSITMRDGAELFVQGQRVAKGQDMCNLFGVVHYSSQSATPLLEHPQVRACENGVIFVKHELCDANLSDGLWWEEDVFQHNLNFFREKERELEARDLMFNYRDMGMSFQTSYLAGHCGSKDFSTSLKYNPNGWLKYSLKIFLAPFDITKAQFDCVVFSHEIDSVNLRLSFMEGVQISCTSNLEPNKVDMHHISFCDIGRVRSPELRKAIHRVSPAMQQIKYGDIVQQKHDGGTSLFVTYLSYRNIQWLRLFILTTILAFCLAQFVKSVYQIVVHIYKSKKK